MKLVPYLILVFSTFFAPIVTVMCAILVLMLIDLIVGVIASKKRGEKFSSTKLGNSGIKLLLYLIGIITGHLMALYFIPGIPWVNIVAGLIGATKVVSIFENISDVTGTNFIRYIKDTIVKYRKKD